MRTANGSSCSQRASPSMASSPPDDGCPTAARRPWGRGFSPPVRRPSERGAHRTPLSISSVYGAATGADCRVADTIVERYREVWRRWQVWRVGAEDAPRPSHPLLPARRNRDRAEGRGVPYDVTMPQGTADIIVTVVPAAESMISCTIAALTGLCRRAVAFVDHASLNQAEEDQPGRAGHTLSQEEFTSTTSSSSASDGSEQTHGPLHDLLLTKTAAASTTTQQPQPPDDASSLPRARGWQRRAAGLRDAIKSRAKAALTWPRKRSSGQRQRRQQPTPLLHQTSVVELIRQVPLTAWERPLPPPWGWCHEMPIAVGGSGASSSSLTLLSCECRSTSAAPALMGSADDQRGSTTAADLGLGDPLQRLAGSILRVTAHLKQQQQQAAGVHAGCTDSQGVPPSVATMTTPVRSSRLPPHTTPPSPLSGSAAFSILSSHRCVPSGSKKWPLMLPLVAAGTTSVDAERPYWRREHDALMAHATTSALEVQYLHKSSLLTAETHTEQDVRRRQLYNGALHAIVDDAVSALTETLLAQRRAAADRAASEWLYRQILRTSDRQLTVSRKTPLSFTGIRHHIQSGQAASLDYLVQDDHDTKLLHTVFAQAHSQDSCVHFGGKQHYSPMTFAQLATLKPGTWVNDQVINNYLQLLCDTASEQWGMESVVSLGTHFYAKVDSELQALMAASGARRHGSGASGTDELPRLPAQNALLRWLRRRAHILLPYEGRSVVSRSCTANTSTVAAATTSVGTVLVPVNLSGQHWALAAWRKDVRDAACPDGCWFFYDSLASPSAASHARALRVLRALSHTLSECRRHLCPTAPLKRDAVRLRVAMPYNCLSPMRHESPLDSLYPFEGEVGGGFEAAQRSQQRYDSVRQHRAKRLRSGGSDWGDEGANDSEEWNADGWCRQDEIVYWCATGSGKGPQQHNGDDCGIFVCQTAWCISQGLAVSYSHRDAAMLRCVILMELWERRLLQRLPSLHTSSSAAVSVWKTSSATRCHPPELADGQ